MNGRYDNSNDKVFVCRLHGIDGQPYSQVGRPDLDMIQKEVRVGMFHVEKGSQIIPGYSRPCPMSHPGSTLAKDSIYRTYRACDERFL